MSGLNTISLSVFGPFGSPTIGLPLQWFSIWSRLTRETDKACPISQLAFRELSYSIGMLNNYCVLHCIQTHFIHFQIQLKLLHWSDTVQWPQQARCKPHLQRVRRTDDDYFQRLGTWHHSTSPQYITTVRHHITSLQYVTTVHYHSTSPQYITTVCHYSTSLQYVTTVRHYSTSLQYITRVHHYSTSLQYVITVQYIVHNACVYKHRTGVADTVFTHISLDSQSFLGYS